jgi:uncharacterized protein with GYD domain
MAKYAFFFGYSAASWARMISAPGDRTAAVRRMLDSVGGSLESVYWMFGGHDGFVIADIPDSVAAATVSVAAASTGAFDHSVTHELLTQEQLEQALRQAQKSAREFPAPAR